MEVDILGRLPDALLPWYEENHRKLPWREDRDPYHIWLSEIMLQQTRVEAVKGYYSRFLLALPTIGALAEAEEELLHKLWEGLGYYSRVRNLKKAAVEIMEKHGGIFPESYEQLRALPGIGPYTAGAISSIAYDMPKAAVDGNVLRVYTRLMEDGTEVSAPAFRKKVEKALEEIYPAKAGAFTQAIMELGATVCVPNGQPQCESCPCGGFCRARKNGTAMEYPVKAPKKPRRVEEYTVFIFSCEGRYALEKRSDTGLLASLWQFPNVRGKLDTAEAVAAVEKMGGRLRQLFWQVERFHVFTHIRWELRGIYMEITEPLQGFTWLTAAEIEKNAALPTAFRQFWEERNV